jgi:hypothetical protein
VVPGIAAEGDGAARGVEEQPHREEGTVFHGLEPGHEASWRGARLSPGLDAAAAAAMAQAKGKQHGMVLQSRGGLRYPERANAAGVQTERRGVAGPMSVALRAGLTGFVRIRPWQKLDATGLVPVVSGS